MLEERINFKRETLTLQGLIHKPNMNSYDLAILLYGFAGQMVDSPSNLLPELAHRLWQKNIATLRFDFSGHGKSDGNIEDMNIFSQLEDASAAIQYAKSLTGIKNIYLVGHSQGGVIASMISGYYADTISKEILINPAATMVDDAKIGRCWGVNYNPDHIPDKIKLAPFTLNSFYFRTAKFLNIFDVAGAFKNPALILAGSDDKIVNNYVSRRYHATLPQSSFYLLKNGNHNMDNIRNELYDLIVQFLK